LNPLHDRIVQEQIKSHLQSNFLLCLSAEHHGSLQDKKSIRTGLGRLEWLRLLQRQVRIVPISNVVDFVLQRGGLFSVEQFE
jgi:hypothetical protein